MGFAPSRRKKGIALSVSKTAFPGLMKRLSRDRGTSRDHEKNPGHNSPNTPKGFLIVPHGLPPLDTF
jgi:hypothetical protein